METTLLVLIGAAAGWYLYRRFTKPLKADNAACGCGGCGGCSSDSALGDKVSPDPKAPDQNQDRAADCSCHGGPQ